jgi:hypothetical protein
MNPWIWRIIIVLVAIALIPIIVQGTTNLISNVIEIFSQNIHDLFEPLSKSGEKRLLGIIRLCLYLISITLLARFLLGRTGGE